MKNLLRFNRTDRQVLLSLAILAAFFAGTATYVGCGGCKPIEPPKPVVENGPRDMLIVYESAAETPEQSALFVSLRKDEVAGPLKAAGHTLEILDTDSTDEKNQPAAVLAKHKADIDAAGLPCLLIMEHKSGNVLSKETLPASVDAVLASLKAHGG